MNTEEIQRINDSFIKLAWVVLAFIAFFSLLDSFQKYVIKNLTGVEILGLKLNIVPSKAEVLPSDNSAYKIELTIAQRDVILERSKLLYSRLKGANILWIDDNPGRNSSTQHFLQNFGVKFKIACSSREADKYLADTTNKFDIMISDVGRPDAIETVVDKQKAGLYFIAKHKKRGIPFIFFTGHTEEFANGYPEGVFAVANRTDYLIHYVLDALERGGAPYPAGNQFVAK